MAQPTLDPELLLPWERPGTPTTHHDAFLKIVSDRGEDHDADSTDGDEEQTPDEGAPEAEEEEQASDEQVDDSDEADEEFDEEEADEAGSEEGPELYPVFDEHGKESWVTLQEAKDGGLRQADYTRKQQANSVIRQEAEAERAAAVEVREQYVSQIELLQEQLAMYAPAAKTPEAWNELRASNPGEYAAQLEEHRAFAQRTEGLATQRAELLAETAKEQQTKWDAYVEAESTKLVAAMPGWEDSEVADREAAELTEFAKDTYGFSDVELSTVVDSRHIRLLKDAMTGMKAAQEGTTKLTGQVKGVRRLKAGSRRKSQGTTSGRKRTRQLQNTVRQSGQEADGFEAILDIVNRTEG